MGHFAVSLPLWLMLIIPFLGLVGLPDERVLAKGVPFTAVFSSQSMVVCYGDGHPSDSVGLLRIETGRLSRI